MVKITQGMISFTTTITINMTRSTMLDVVMAACSHGLPPKDPRLWLSFSLLLLRLRRRWYYIASTTYSVGRRLTTHGSTGVVWYT